MDLKKTLSLCVALLLVVGFSSQSSALNIGDATQQGVWVRTASPAASTFGKIADTIRVNVFTLSGIVDTMFISIVTDTTSTVSTLAAARTVVANANVTNTSGKTGATVVGGKSTTGTGSIVFSTKMARSDAASSSQDTFKVKFGIAGGDTSFQNSTALKVLIHAQRASNNAGNAYTQFTNLQTGLQILPGTSSLAVTPVGDGIQFSMDGKRPISTSVLDSVRIDTSGLAAGLAGTAATIKNGSTVIIRLHIDIGGVIASGASSARVILVDQGQSINTASVIDSNLSYNKVFTDLFSGQILRDTIIAAAGQFSNNQRIMPVAFLEDVSGNLSAATADAVAPAGFTSGLVYFADSTVPVITPIEPHPDSSVKRISGAISNNLVALRSSVNGSSANVAFAANPLEFKVNEDAKTVTANFLKGSSAGADTTLTLVAASFKKDVAVKSATTLNNTTPAGKSLTIKLTVTDSVGNTSSVSIAGVGYDETVPSILQQFPTQSGAPRNISNSNKPTINGATKNPVFRVDELLDSVSVRYVQVAANPPDVALQGMSPGNTKLTKVKEDILATVNDTLIDGNEYTLQIVLVDLARNASVSAPDTLTFTKAFNNPEADSFVVAIKSGAAHGDSVIAGQQFLMTVTAIDTGLTNSGGSNVKAVTYGGSSRIIARLDSANVASVKFGGSGVTDNGDGSATLDTDGWVVGGRSLFFTSNLASDNFAVVMEDISTDAEGNTVVNFNGAKDSVSVDAAEMAKYKVSALEGGEIVTGVAGDFGVSVVAVDAWGNPSTKTRSIASGSTIALTDSTGLLDSRINAQFVLDELLVVFSTNEGDASVPSGPQALGAGTATFTAVAPNRSGSGLWVGVRTYNANADSSGHANSQAKHSTAQGNTGALAFAASGEAPPAGGGDAGAPAAPANLVVQDYMGANGDGDQGGFVLASFPNSAGPVAVGVYRIYRLMEVNTSLDAEGNVVEGDAVETWVPWTALDAVPGVDVQRAVIPTLGNAKTGWAVAAEKGSSTSAATAAGKRVFTKESVQQIVKLLGVETSILSHTELVKQFTAPQDYVKSILGDQKNLRFAALDLDVTGLLGGSAVPQSIRTAGHVRVSSAKTETKEPVAAVDNIAPAAVVVGDTENAIAEEGDAVKLSWTSADDKIVAFSTYRGYTIPIAGVDRYEVLRGTSEEDLTKVADLRAGANEFVDTDLPKDAESLIYRVDALDLDNLTMGALVTVTFREIGRKEFFQADGETPVYIVKLDGGTPLKQDFEDFIAFAQTYSLSAGDANFNPQADIDDNGVVEFADFIQFARRYDSEAAGPAGKRAVVPARPGINDNAEFSLSLGSDRVLVGEMITVDVTVANAQALVGYGLVLSYDTDKFEFVTATPAQDDLLKSSGGDTPLFHHWPTSGEVTVANAVVNGSAVSGEGKIATLTFKVLREFEDNARFEIGQGVVFDPDQLQNPVVTQGALTVESTPTEFALLQNFPNPFNPETTIGYNLAEGGDVSLRIYNIVGQVVRTLVNDRQSAGRYQVRWSGIDDRGVAVSSGIYFYQVSAAGKFQDVKRLMLLK